MPGGGGTGNRRDRKGAWRGRRYPRHRRLFTFRRSDHQSLDGTTQILTPAKVNEMFHPDWTVHDRQLAKAIGFKARYDLAGGFRDTVLWYRNHKWL